MGKLTLLSADCAGSGAVVGSSAMVADSSGADGGGWDGGVPGGAGVACVVVCGTAAGALDAARSVRNAAPTNSTVVSDINQILLCITHHSKAYCCSDTVGTVTPGQSQIRRGGGLPVCAPYHMASSIDGPQRVSDRSCINERQVVVVNPFRHVTGHVLQPKRCCLELAYWSGDRIFVPIAGQ